MESSKDLLNIKKLNIILFDVSLRDGLQGLPIKYHEIYTTEYKKKIFDDIIIKYNPKNIEIGSIINSKIMPIMKDSIELFEIIYKLPAPINNYNIYLLIPNKNNLLKAIENNIINYSFITSVSNSFQLKNIKKNINETKIELNDMVNIVNELKKNNSIKYNVKLYISCIDECPIEGKINNDFIIDEIFYYYQNFDIDIYCLCDTCGTLNYFDYKYIIDNLINKKFPIEKISLHLHVDLEKNIFNIENIIFYSLDNNIKQYDISLLEFGGCSLTIKINNLHQNLSYQLFFDIIQKYINLIDL
jgi:isopropylmalate/homocitrate/citramalate synthase